MDKYVDRFSVQELGATRSKPSLFCSKKLLLILDTFVPLKYPLS